MTRNKNIIYLFDLKAKSVKSINQCKPALPSGRSVIQTTYDIVTKGHGGVPILIGMKVETKVDEGNPDNFGKGEGLSAEALAQAGTTFIIKLPA